MTIHLVETYEEDACIAVARHIAALLDEGQVGNWGQQQRFHSTPVHRRGFISPLGVLVLLLVTRSGWRSCAHHCCWYCCVEPQAKTALADTTGSVFLQKCIAAANDGRWDELIKQLSAHLDLVFSKCSDKGRCLERTWAGGLCAPQHSMDIQAMQLFEVVCSEAQCQDCTLAILLLQQLMVNSSLFQV